MKIPSSHKQKFAQFLELIEHAKDGGLDMVVVNHPEVLGDDYGEIVLNLNLLAEANVPLSIVPPKERMSPDLIRPNKVSLVS